MARRKATAEVKPEPTFKKTEWISLDLRSKKEREEVLRYCDAERILIAVVNMIDEGGTFNVKLDEGKGVKATAFLPTDDSNGQIGLSAYGKTAFEALASLSYKYEVLLPQFYETGDELGEFGIA
jgi:hypothetical protein